MRIAFASDLHLEFPNTDPRALAFPTDVDVIVLAGDIHVGDKVADLALALADRYPRAHIVWVAGNHEFYRRNIDRQTVDYWRSCTTHGRVHFLENGSVEIKGYTFLGCTLWTDFSLFGRSKKCRRAAESISDFGLIRTEDDRPLEPADAAKRLTESRQFLEHHLASGNPATTVVVTHFSPGLESRNTKFRLDDITPYFQSNVDGLIDTYQPCLWIYGHNHYSNDFYRGKTRLVSNQLGYPSEAGYIPKYDPSRTIVLNDRE
jgi:Icc-related predicted phosphoesterase